MEAVLDEYYDDSSRDHRPEGFNVPWTTGVEAVPDEYHNVVKV